MKTTLAKPRHYVSEDLVLDWENIEPLFFELISRTINSVTELITWLRDRSELDAVLQEDYAWRYINMTKDTSDK